MGWIVTDKPVCLLLILLVTRPLYTRQELAELSRPADDGNSTADVEQTTINRSPTDESQDPRAYRSPTQDPQANTTENLVTGEASVERWTQSLTRLEGSLGSLIQSFLAMQRSVFNLEQLQELLVLLLEDILRQAGTLSKSPNAKPDERAKSSAESRDFDDTQGGGRGGLEDGRSGAGQPDGETARRGQGTNPFLSTNELGLKENQIRSDKDEATAWGDDSSEERRGASGERPSPTGNTSPAQVLTSVPQWSEPLMEMSDTQARFHELVQRLSSRLASLVHVHPGASAEVNPVPPESPLERPRPPMEPLEINTGLDHVMTGPETLPLSIKLRSPVVSHGGPRTGPEKNGFPFLENLGGAGLEDDSGEVPTGLINNLRMYEGNHTTSPAPGTGGLAAGDQPTSRRKRQVRPRPGTSLLTQLKIGVDTKPIAFNITTGKDNKQPRVLDVNPGHVSNITAAYTRGGTGTPPHTRDVTATLPQSVSNTASPPPTRSEAASTPPTRSDAASPPPTRSEAASTPPTRSDAASPPPTRNDAASPLPTRNDAASPPPTKSEAAEEDHLIASLLEQLSRQLQSLQATRDVNSTILAIHQLNKSVWVPDMSRDPHTPPPYTARHPPYTARHPPSDAHKFQAAPAGGKNRFRIFSLKQRQLNQTEQRPPADTAGKADVYKTSALHELGVQQVDSGRLANHTGETTMEDLVYDQNLTDNVWQDWAWFKNTSAGTRASEADRIWLKETLAQLLDWPGQSLPGSADQWDTRDQWGTRDQTRPAGRDQGEDGENSLDTSSDHDDQPSSQEQDITPLTRLETMKTKETKHNLLHTVMEDVIWTNDIFTHKGDIYTDNSRDSEELLRDKRQVQQPKRINSGQRLQKADLLHKELQQKPLTGEEGNKKMRSRQKRNNFLWQLGHDAMDDESPHPSHAAFSTNHFSLSSLLRPGQASYIQTRQDPYSSGISRYINQPHPTVGRFQSQIPSSSPAIRRHPTQPRQVGSSNYALTHPRRIGTTNYLAHPRQIGTTNYLAHLGLKDPSWLQRTLEPDEAQDPTDVDEILSDIFQSYWRRLHSRYLQAIGAATTTEEVEEEGEATQLPAASSATTTPTLATTTARLLTTTSGPSPDTTTYARTDPTTPARTDPTTPARIDITVESVFNSWSNVTGTDRSTLVTAVI